MREEWPFVARDRELSQVEDILGGGRYRGIVLVGPAGVGKSRLAAEALALAERAGYATLRATATREKVPLLPDRLPISVLPL